MQSAFRQFINRIDNYEVALFYYAGHGMQVDGQNYLLPVDAVLEDKLSLDFEAFKLNSVNKYFAQNLSKMNIMILDACRNNPYRSWARGGQRGFSALKEQGAGTIIAFATREGDTASDGTGANGLYTTHLVEQMKIPQSINDVFLNTRVGVLKSSNNNQIPQEWNMLTGNFYFKNKELEVVNIPEKKTYEEDIPSEMKIMSPKFSDNEKPLVVNEKLKITGIVNDQDGLKNFYINNEKINYDNVGYFSVELNLTENTKNINFEIQDVNDNYTTSSKRIEYKKSIVESESIPEKDGKINIGAAKGLIEANSSNYYALIIANSNYDDPGINDLDHPVSDANKLAEVLLSKYSFIPKNVTFLEDPSRSEVIEQMDVLISKVGSNDNVLIFYAGHGYWDNKSEIGYWLPRNARKKSKADWLRNNTMAGYIREINSNHTLLITDACFSGGIFNVKTAFRDTSIDINKLYTKVSRNVMTSGVLSEVPDKSIFMKYLIKTLESNEEKYISSESLFSNCSYE